MSNEIQRPSAGAVDLAAVRLMVVGLAGGEYAIPTDMVQSIDPYRPPRPVPGSASHVEGVVTLRGRLVPVVSLRARLGLGEAPSTADARIVILASGALAAGVVVDDVREVVDVAPRRYAAARRPAAAHGLVAGILRIDGHRLTLLDLPGLLAEGALAA